MSENVTNEQPTDSTNTDDRKQAGQGTKIAAWVVAGLFLLIQLPVFLAFLIAPGPATAGSATGAVLGAAILRFVILKLGAYVTA